MIEMQGVTKVFRTDVVETHALKSFSLRVESHEFLAITGPSGSGKTTFLNVAGLLEEFTSGQYLLNGKDVSRLKDDERSRIRNESIGFIFQSFNLIPDLNIYDNVEVPLHYRGLPGAERRKRVVDIHHRLSDVRAQARFTHGADDFLFVAQAPHVED